jgi:hypothetical protein
LDFHDPTRVITLITGRTVDHRHPRANITALALTGNPLRLTASWSLQRRAAPTEPDPIQRRKDRAGFSAVALGHDVNQRTGLIAWSPGNTDKLGQFLRDDLDLLVCYRA